jgi:hypothetical protein
MRFGHSFGTAEKQRSPPINPLRLSKGRDSFFGESHGEPGAAAAFVYYSCSRNVYNIKY